MDNKGFSLQHLSRAAFPFNRESPFSSVFFKEDIPASASQTTLLGFPSSTSHTRTQHRYCLTNGNNNGKVNDQSWLTLLVRSRSPKPKFLPLFFGKDAVSGTVELELTKPETVREVKVTVSEVFPLHHMYILIHLPPSSSRERQPISPKNRKRFLKYHKLC